MCKTYPPTRLARRSLPSHAHVEWPYWPWVILMYEQQFYLQSEVKKTICSALNMSKNATNKDTSYVIQPIQKSTVKKRTGKKSQLSTVRWVCPQGIPFVYPLESWATRGNGNHKGEGPKPEINVTNRRDNLGHFQPASHFLKCSFGKLSDPLSLPCLYIMCQIMRHAIERWCVPPCLLLLSRLIAGECWWICFLFLHGFERCSTRPTFSQNDWRCGQMMSDVWMFH